MDINKALIFLILCSLVSFIGFSQELEPRAMNNLPIGTNFLIGGYGFANGNILMDPAIPIEDLNSNLHTGFAAYVRSINLFGLSAKVDVIIPYAAGDWEGNLDDEYSTRSQNGFGDMRVRFSFNFLGSKAMNISDFQNYKPESVSGISVQIIAPTGDYNPEELINIGSNRWAFKTQWGFARNFNKWIIESYVGMWLFTKNTNFLNGNQLSQKPLYTVKVHFIRELPKKMWVALNVGYGIGGKTELNGVPRDTEISTSRLGLIYALPVAKKHTVKFAYISGFRFKRGPDFDAVSISYQYRWNKHK
ncbi:MAG: hypothetical protein GQ552_09725 [Flavobacteriaceae bacterium]|nr:hypothetical protein [Flavobacteriaceae bacterium]